MDSYVGGEGNLGAIQTMGIVNGACLLFEKNINAVAQMV